MIGRPRGMAAFTIIWLGQIFSSGATRMVNFALAIWVWQQTNSASDLALLTLMAFAATVVVSPFVGSLIDRWSRRTAIVASDGGSVLVTLAALALFATGNASFWPLVAVNTVSGAFLAFQYPAYSALVTTLLPKEQYARANGMLSMVRSVPAIFAPAVAGALMAFSGIWVVLVVALASYVVAIITVFMVSVPGARDRGAGGKSSFWQDSVVGFRHLVQVPGYAGLQGILFVIGLVSAMGFIALTPLVLLKSGNNEAQLGAVNSIGAVGGVLGAIILGAIKSPPRKMLRVLTGILVFSLFGRVVLGLGDTFVIWAAAWFISWMSIPFIEGYVLAIWQQKIPPAIQGRVFAAIQFLSQLALLIGFAATGPLIDGVLEPQATAGSGIGALSAPIIGTEPGAGMKLVFLLSGIAGILSAMFGFASRRVRNIETIVPDHDAPTGETPTASVGDDGTLDERTADHDRRAAVPGTS